MDRKKRKALLNYISNGLLGLIILTLLIPSWRRKFQGFTQGLFMTSATLETNYNQSLNLNQTPWLIYDKNQVPIKFSDLNDKPIVLNFWATWCPSCLAEMPALKEFNSHLDGLAHVICVTNESFETVNESGFFEKYDGIIYYVPSFSPLFDFQVYPTTFVINLDQHIVSKIEGAHQFNTTENINFIKGLSNFN